MQGSGGQRGKKDYTKGKCWRRGFVSPASGSMTFTQRRVHLIFPTALDEALLQRGLHIVMGAEADTVRVMEADSACDGGRQCV
eukprot:1628409-Pleurochrysis_carterae.AAC.1